MRLTHAVLFVLAVGVAAGCNAGPKLDEVYPVTGTVTGGTGSLAGVIIAFSPIDETGSSSSGTIGADGKYTLQSADGRTGAAKGQYKVTLSLPTEGGQQSMAEMMSKMGKKRSGSGTSAGPPKVEAPFPQKYRSAESSDKSVEVKAEPNVIDIAL